MTQVELTNVSSKDSPVVDRLRNLLEGNTYMGFRILVCPVGGSCDVLAETDYTDDVNEVKDFLLDVLASRI